MIRKKLPKVPKGYRIVKSGEVLLGDLYWTGSWWERAYGVLGVSVRAWGPIARPNAAQLRQQLFTTRHLLNEACAELKDPLFEAQVRRDLFVEKVPA